MPLRLNQTTVDSKDTDCNEVKKLLWDVLLGHNHTRDVSCVTSPTINIGRCWPLQQEVLVCSGLAIVPLLQLSVKTWLIWVQNPKII